MVTGAFEMGDAAQTPLYSADDMLRVKVALREQIRASSHPAFILWLVGNELNGGWQLFVCDQDYAMLHKSS